MSNRGSLLIEVGTEELPAFGLLKAFDNLKKSWLDIVKEANLEGNFEFFYTPRRLVIKGKDILLKQPNKEEEIWGPPIEIAYKDGEPTKAAEAFAKKNSIDLKDINVKKRGDREFLYLKREIKGKETKELLPSMVKRWIASLDFGKSMRWGDLKEEFIRPVRWFQLRLNNDVVDCEIFGVKSNNFTYPHRVYSFDPQVIENIEDFDRELKRGGVELSQDKRRESILKEFNQIEKDENITIQKDKDLLEEVVAITENPKVLVGEIDEEFLTLPPEVIITSMKEHQRYFPVFKDNKLLNKFVFVSNALTNDYSKIIKGNERVLRPRLSDALFFYKNDLKRGLSIDGLSEINFMEGVGSLKDKVERELKIAKYLASLYKDKLTKLFNMEFSEIEKIILRGVELSKADLLSEMVYEFPELQGIMGYYYALALGENELVALAIKEQYKPAGEKDQLPSNLISAIVALSLKIDTLMALFSIGKIPTGSKDPFALRRGVIGIIRIVNNFDIPFNLKEIFGTLKELYRDFDINLLINFVLERLKKYYKVNPSIINAVISTKELDLREIDKKIKALDKITKSSNFKEIFEVFKRVANISKDIDLNSNLRVDEKLFEKEEERVLYKKFLEIKSKKFSNYEEKLNALFSLKDDLEKFFDNVMVNVDDKSIRENRLNLIGSIYKEFRSIADIKEISI